MATLDPERLDVATRALIALDYPGRSLNAGANRESAYETDRERYENQARAAVAAYLDGSAPS